MNSFDEPKITSARYSVSLARLGAYAILAIGAAAAGVISALAIFGAGENGWIGPSATEHHAEASANSVARFVVHAEPVDVPNLSFNDANGKSHRLSEWRGKAVLLNLWATWCAPCKTEMPSLDRLQARLGGEKFGVVALSTDRTGPKEPAAFFATQGITHLALFNDETAAAIVSMKAAGLPLTIVLNEDGRETARLLGPADWDSPEAAIKIEKILGRGNSSG